MMDDVNTAALELIMQAEIFNEFRLVGGTSLSLQLGHRVSVDLDLFTDESYGSTDFEAIDRFLTDKFNYLSHSRILPAMGKSYLVGTDPEHTVKLDVYYTDPFIRPALVTYSIRLVAIDEIVAMKMDVIQRTGRKKKKFFGIFMKSWTSTALIRCWHCIRRDIRIAMMKT